MNEDNNIQVRIDAEVERRVKEEIQKLADNPQAVIAAYAARVHQLEVERDAMEPKADFYDTVTQTDEWEEMATVAKLLAHKGMGRNNIFQLLRDRQVLRYNNEPYQQYVERGYFKTVEQHWTNPATSEVIISKKTVVSQKGLDFVRKILEEVQA